MGNVVLVGPECDVKQVVEGIRTNVEQLVTNARLKLKPGIDAKNSIILVGDPDRIKEIAQELPMHVQDAVFKQVDQYKICGVVVDSKLNGHALANMLAKKLPQRINAAMSVLAHTHRVSGSDLKNLTEWAASSIFRFYASPLAAMADLQTMELVQNLHKAALCKLLHVPHKLAAYFMDQDRIYKALKQLTFKNRCAVEMLVDVARLKAEGDVDGIHARIMQHLDDIVGTETQIYQHPQRSGKSLWSVLGRRSTTIKPLIEITHRHTNSLVEVHNSSIDFDDDSGEGGFANTRVLTPTEQREKIKSYGLSSRFADPEIRTTKLHYVQLISEDLRKQGINPQQCIFLTQDESLQQGDDSYKIDHCATGVMNLSYEWPAIHETVAFQLVGPTTSDNVAAYTTAKGLKRWGQKILQYAAANNKTTVLSFLDNSSVIETKRKYKSVERNPIYVELIEAEDFIREHLTVVRAWHPTKLWIQEQLHQWPGCPHPPGMHPIQQTHELAVKIRHDHWTELSEETEIMVTIPNHPQTVPVRLVPIARPTVNIDTIRKVIQKWYWERQDKDLDYRGEKIDYDHVSGPRGVSSKYVLSWYWSILAEGEAKVGTCSCGELRPTTTHILSQCEEGEKWSARTIAQMLQNHDYRLYRPLEREKVKHQCSLATHRKTALHNHQLKVKSMAAAAAYSKQVKIPC